MDVQTIEAIINIAQDANTLETLKMLIGLGGALFGKSFVTGSCMVMGGIGITFTVVSTISSQICAMTETKDTKAYKIMEVFARNIGKAKDEVKQHEKIKI